MADDYTYEYKIEALEGTYWAPLNSTMYDVEDEALSVCVTEAMRRAVRNPHSKVRLLRRPVTHWTAVLDFCAPTEVAKGEKDGDVELGGGKNEVKDGV